jgi:hypothetical protein
MSVLSDEDNSSYARYQAVEQRDRGIIRHLLLSVSAGTAAGAAGTLIHVSGLVVAERVYDPYAYFLLTVIVGRTAAGLGWALLSSTLAALAPMIPSLTDVGLSGHDVRALAGDPEILNLLVLALIGFGLAGYAARGPGLAADTAAGAICGALLAEVCGRALPGMPDGDLAFRPWPALVVALLVLGLLAVLRRTSGARLRALAVAGLVVAGYLVARTVLG